jgi:hypothetical protein
VGWGKGKGDMEGGGGGGYIFSILSMWPSLVLNCIFGFLIVALIVALEGRDFTYM